MAGTLGDLVARHCAHLAYLGRARGTVDQRRWLLRRLATWLAPRSLLDPSAEQLVAFSRRPGRGASARAAEVTHMRGFYRWAHTHGLVERDPTYLLHRPALPRRLPRPIPDDRLAVALDRASARVRPWLYLAAYAGLRCCEIARGRSDDWQRDLGVIVVVGKGGDEAAVPVAPILADVLDVMPPGWWAPRWDGRPGPLSANMVSQHGNRALRDLGIDDTMHSLRHWCGTQTYRVSGRDIRLTQEMLRHRSPTSTALYTWVDPGDLAGVAARLPGLGRRALRAVG
ncbi:MAG: hypothetical protein DCC47_16050 [Acidobacteria bacterium]|nr:MAG: hypothetical protein DCC47_16050 [Acidobacteriota bacterium]